MDPLSPPQPPAPRDLALVPRPPGFASGLRAFFGGFACILSDPSLWPFAAVPAVVALSLTGLFGWGVVAFVPSQIEALLAPHVSGVLVTVAEIVASALLLLVALLLAFALAQPLSGPALERIVRRVEERLGAPSWPPTSFVVDVGRSLQSVLVSYAFGLPILALLFLVNVVFPPAAVVTVPLKLAVAALLLTWDFCDYPLSARGVPIGTRVAFLRRNASAALGFGLGLALLALVPCLLLLVLPAGVAGATRLVAEIERHEGAAGAAGRPDRRA